MQINRVGYGLVAFFGIAGLLLAIVPLFVSVPIEAVATLVLLGGIWFLVALGLLFYARHQKRKAAHQDWVFQNGIKGTATIVKASSNATVNEMPLMKMVLDLDVPGLERRQVTRREVMSVFAGRRLEPGLVLPVHVNPEDPSDFVLVW
ncbi:MAG: hypothetical protein ABW065_09265 [Solirubrobacterales bacterium]